MVNTKTIVMAFVAAAVGIAAVWFFCQSEEAKVKKRFDFLSQYFEKEPSESKLISAARSKKIQKLFTKTIGLEIPAYDISREFDRSELAPLILAGRHKFSEIRLTFHDITVDFPVQAEARVSVTANLVGKSRRGEPVDEVHELECFLDKVEDEWYFKSFEAVEVLKR